MALIKALTAVAHAIHAYFDHRRETDLDRRIAESRAELREMFSDMDRLRADGSPAATQRADWMRGEYGGEAKHLAHLRARRIAAEGGAERSDD